MIYDDRQYEVSTGKLADLKDALGLVKARDTKPERLKNLEIDAIESLIEEIEADINHYDSLKSDKTDKTGKTGKIGHQKACSLESLPVVLVEARIAGGVSQPELAELLGIEPVQIQRYEDSGYAGASHGMLLKAAEILRVRTAGLFETEALPKDGMRAFKG